jgi:hypothetical protein
MDRKLAAILAADVVGYSTLMEQDEHGTFERLRSGRKELFEPEIARNHSRVFKHRWQGHCSRRRSKQSESGMAITPFVGLQSPDRAQERRQFRETRAATVEDVHPFSVQPPPAAVPPDDVV